MLPGNWTLFQLLLSSRAVPERHPKDRHRVPGIPGLASLALLAMAISPTRSLAPESPPGAVVNGIRAGNCILSGNSRFQLPAINAAAKVAGRHAGRHTEENRDVPSKNLYWRLTKDGWQYVHIEPPELVPAAIQPVLPPAVHPVIVTMLIALGAVAAVAWASDEWDWHRVIRE